MIGVAGGSGSGKTTLAKELLKFCSEKNLKAQILRQDSYYIDQSDKFDKDGGAVNFDHPDSLEFSLLVEHLKELKQGKSISIPIYDFATHTRARHCEIMAPSPIIIVDGILIFSQPGIVEELDLKIFVDASEENRYQRRLNRDVKERGRTEEGVRDQFFNQVKPMHDEFVEPSKGLADVVIDNNHDIGSFLEDCDRLYALIAREKSL